MRIYAGEIRQRVSSPDGKFVAQVRELNSGSAVDADYVSVQLQTKWNPIRHHVYGGLDYGIGIGISWMDSTNLLVTCTKCEKLGMGFKEDKWREVTIHYLVQ
jgi:hypothetical protein